MPPASWRYWPARPGRRPLTFLAVAAIGLALLVWLSMLLWLAGADLSLMFPRLLVLPALAYLASIEFGELQGLPNGSERTMQRPSAPGDGRHGRWIIYAGCGLTTLFLAVLAGSAVPVLFAAAIGGMAVLRLATLSGRMVRSDRVVDLFDNLMSQLARSANTVEVLDRASDVARSLLGADAEVELTGDGTERDTARDPVNAVLSQKPDGADNVITSCDGRGGATGQVSGQPHRADHRIRGR